jgi:S1-C subfamily serine protease
MISTTRSFVILSLLLILMASLACSSPDAPTTPAALPAPTVDLAALADTVVARVQAQLPQPAAEADAEALRATIEAVLEENLPALDMDALVQLVDEAVTARLAQMEQRTPISQPGAALAGSDLELQATLVALYQQANPSVVYIITSTGSGSGFVYDALGHIVTNRHVVSGSRQFEIVFAGGERLAAELVGADADSDLAVLKVDALPDGVQPLPLADPDTLQVGQFVAAIGNPFGEQGSMSVGIVSGLSRSLRSQRTQGPGFAYSLPGVIQTDAPINPGNSGGPLLNLTGEVVGVNSAIASVTGVNSGVGFSIPVIAVHRMVPNLIEQGSHTYSYMGLSFASELSLSDQSRFGLPQTQGAYILSLAAGSPADRAGLRAADVSTGRGGDLVIAIDGRSVRNFDELNAYLVFYTAPGQTIEMTVLRNGEELTLPLTLGARP